MKKLLALLSAPLFIGGCADDTFPKYVELGGLRVLGIRAELSGNAATAEFSPGDTVKLLPYISDFRGGTRVLSYSAVGCLDPGVSLGAEPSCDAAVGGSTVLASGTVSFASGAVERTGRINDVTLMIPSAILTGRSSVEQYNGVTYLVLFTVSSADGAQVSSFKRLPVSTSTKTKNRNPTLSNLLVNGAALSSLPTVEVALGASYAAGSIESYLTLNSSAALDSKTEELVTTYFITDGKLKYFRTVNEQTTNYTPPSIAPTDHQALIVGVLRDSRGGVDVKIQGL